MTQLALRRRRDVGELFRESLAVFGRHLLLFIALSAVVVVPAELIVEGVGMEMLTSDYDSSPALAEVETTDNGKLLAEMRAQLHYAPKWFHYFAGLADKIEGRVLPSDKPHLSVRVGLSPKLVGLSLVDENSTACRKAW